MNSAHYYLLPRFLTISIVLHLCLLVGLGHSILITPNLNLGQSVLEVNFPDHVFSSKEIPPLKTTVSPVAKKSDTQAIPSERSIASSAPLISTTEAGPPATVQTADSRENLHNQLLGALKTRLSQYLTYPPLARRHGWEGMVLLGMRVEADGRFNEIRIEHSSGYAILDDSALNSLKRLGSFVEARVWLEGHSIDMQLPVIFKLIEN